MESAYPEQGKYARFTLKKEESLGNALPWHSFGGQAPVILFYP